MSATQSKRRSSWSEEERAAYREAKREAAEQALDRLLSEEGWQAWFRLRRNVHSYSWTNQVLIAQQAFERGIEPGIVKAASRWKQDGYHPAKGSKSMFVWVFCSRRRNDGSWTCCKTRRTDSQCPECGRTDHYFKFGPVFDSSDVRSFETGEAPTLDTPHGEPITGNDPGAHLVPVLAAWAVQSGLVASVDLDATSEHGEGGSWNTRTRELRVCKTDSENHRLRVLIHELAHAKGITSKDLNLTYDECEVAVECVSYMVASLAGLDTSSEAIPYMAGWGGEQAREKVRALAQLIDATAKDLEAVILEQQS